MICWLFLDIPPQQFYLHCKVILQYPQCGTNSFVERLCNKKLVPVGQKQWRLEMDRQMVSVLSFAPHLSKGTVPKELKSVFICFSVVHRDSFESIKDLYKDHWWSALKDRPCHKILVGLNADLRTSKLSQKRSIRSEKEEAPNYFAKLPKGT
jgi:hypothetical protein